MRWKCFTQNTIFKLILKIYEFSLKFHAERIQHYSDALIGEPGELGYHNNNNNNRWTTEVIVKDGTTK